MEQERRVLVVSYRQCLTSVAFTGIFDFENLIIEWEQADLIQLPAHRGSMAFDVPRNLYQALRTCGVSTQRALQLTRFRRDQSTPREEYDLVVFVTGSIFDLFGISWLTRLLPAAGNIVAYALEAWPAQIQPGPVDLEPLEVFDKIYIGLTDGTEILRSRHGTRIGFLPPAANVCRYRPEFSNEGKTTMAINLGRFDERQHQALQDLAAERRSSYLHDTISTLVAPSIDRHRQSYADMVSAADIMVSNFAKFDQRRVIGSHREVPMRLFEALAGGCVPAGEKPAVHSMTACELSSVHYLPFALGSNTTAIQQLLDSRDSLRIAQQQNRAVSLRSHDWAHRWKRVLKDLDQTPTPALERRVEAMAAEATELEALSS